MILRVAGLLLIAACLAAMPVRAVASDDIEATLRKADALRSSNPDEFGRLLSRLVAEREQATPAQRERIDYLDAYALGYSGRYDQAIGKLRRLSETSSSSDIRFRASALLVNSYAVTRRFGEGLRELERILPQVDTVRDPGLREHGLAVAALLYNQVGQYRLALDYANRIIEAPLSARGSCFAGQYRLESLQNLGELPGEDGPILDVIERCRAQGELIVANLVRGHLAHKWAAEGQRRKAIELLRTHLAEVRATRYPSLIGRIQSQLAEYVLAEGDLAAAAEHAEQALAQRADIQLTIYLVSAYRTLYEIAERRSDPATALARYRQYAEAEKAYLDEIKAREIAYQLVRHEIMQQTQRIELLNRQNEVLQLQQQIQEQNAQNTRLLVLLLLLLLASIAFWAYKTKRVQMSLRRMAETDALTGICNRHHFTQQSELALAQCARAGEDVALVMFDLDHFKSINDRFGHETGDWVLKQVVAVCAPVCRQIDYFGRIGGEEFAILLIGIDARNAKRLAEDCRVRIAGIDSSDSGYRFNASASFGVTTTALSGYDLAKMLSHADKMLYRAKHGGRNRVFVYEVPVPVQLPVPVGGAYDEPAPAPDAAAEQTGDASDGVAAEERSTQQRAVAVS